MVFSHFYKSPVFATNRQWIRYKSPSYPDPNSFEFSRKKSTADVAPLFSEGSRCIDCPGEMLQGSQESTCRLGYKSPLRYPNRHRGVHLFGFVLQLHIAPRCPTNRHHGFFIKSHSAKDLQNINAYKSPCYMKKVYTMKP